MLLIPTEENLFQLVYSLLTMSQHSSKSCDSNNLATGLSLFIPIFIYSSVSYSSSIHNHTKDMWFEA